MKDADYNANTQTRKPDADSSTRDLNNILRRSDNKIQELFSRDDRRTTPRSSRRDDNDNQASI
jgi:hypothetical protein